MRDFYIISIVLQNEYDEVNTWCRYFDTAQRSTRTPSTSQFNCQNTNEGTGLEHPGLRTEMERKRKIPMRLWSDYNGNSF